MTGFFANRAKSLACTGTALAVAGAGIATSTAATAATAAPAAPAAATVGSGAATAGSQIRPGDDVASQFWAAPERAGAAEKLQAAQALGGMFTAHPQAAHPRAAHRQAATRPAVTRTAVTRTAAARHARVQVVRRSRRPATWQQIQNLVARQTVPKAGPGALPSADRIRPVSVSGPQAYMPISPSRMANATTIVRQALVRHMGLRSAVIAVATAMQESTLENISYGDQDSEGLFQQRPSAGWGSDAQITHPAYAANAFLTALRSHQQADPGWASQPLWENAQAVQNSGFPYAYAKWEAQAAQVVSSITRHMF